jgi:hypothetical protein
MPQQDQLKLEFVIVFTTLPTLYITCIFMFVLFALLSEILTFPRLGVV